MTDDNQLSFNLPSVSRKKVTAAFDGGRLSSDAGVMLLALAERCRKVADTLAAHIADRRDLLRITHTVADVLRARMLAIGCGYPMAMTSTGCAGVRPSSWRAGGCRTTAGVVARSRLSRAGRMRRRCGRSSALLMLWSISGAEVTRSHLGLLSWTSTTRVMLCTATR